MVVGNAVRQLWVWSFRWAILVPSPSWLMRPGTTMLLGNDWHIVLPTVHQTLWCKTLNIIFLYIYVHFKAIAFMNVWYIYIYISLLSMYCFFFFFFFVHVLLIRCGILSPYGESDLENIDSFDGFLPVQWGAIIWTNTDLLFVGPLGMRCNDLYSIMHFKMLSAESQPFCSRLFSVN